MSEASRQRDTTESPRTIGMTARAAVWRAIVFIFCWLVLTRGNLSDLPAALVAVPAATWASLRLMPPENIRVRPVLLIRFAARFVTQAVWAGLDVAARALDPRLPLRPGFVVYRPLLPPGTGFSAFCAVTSLLPGTLPSGLTPSGGLYVHCLDLTQPVTTQLAAEEIRFANMLGGRDA